MSVIKKAIDRMRKGEDIGLDRFGDGTRQQTINKDGSYNMERKTGRLFGNFYLYHWLITTSWTHFWLVVVGFYVVMNLLFASAYYLIGVETLNGIPPGDEFTKFMYCFFFSAQSFTTVGYGALNPLTKISNEVATLEAFTGLMTFALATGTLYGRFSRPISKIKYSKNMLIAPYKDMTGMQFMVANELSSTLMEVEARINLSWMEEEEDGKHIRRFQQVNLEFEKIAMFPTNWVVNHPIDEESALYGKTLQEIREMDVEVFVLLKGFDDVFSQTIYSRQSYKADQFVWGAKFRRPFYYNSEGKMIMDLTKVGEFDQVPMMSAVRTMSESA